MCIPHNQLCFLLFIYYQLKAHIWKYFERGNLIDKIILKHSLHSLVSKESGSRETTRSRLRGKKRKKMESYKSKYEGKNG